VGLLLHQHPAHVRVLDDLDLGGGLVRHLGHVGALLADLGVLEGVEVAGRQRRHGLGADHHARVLDDQEHLADAVVHVTDEVADARGAVLAERELAGRRALDAHLLLDVADAHPVALAERPVGVRRAASGR
jgi:hypothetical protein